MYSRGNMQSEILSWIKIIGTILISWPVVILLALMFFRNPLQRMLKQFGSSNISKAEFGPFKLELNELTE